MFSMENENERLQKLLDFKSDLISTNAHHLRTSLAGLKWTLETILHRDMGEITTEQEEYLQKVYETTDRMISTVGEMLQKNKELAPTDHMETEPVELVHLLTSATDEFRCLAAKMETPIIFDHDKYETMVVQGNKNSLLAVFQNLLENALKYNKPGEPITVALNPGAGTADISVSDRGIGISESAQASIFTKYFRSENAEKQTSQGSGLGLYTSKKIIEDHGGKIWFESRENHGTTFHVSLPLATA